MPAPRTRPATHDDIPAVVDLFWDVAAEGVHLGREVPFDRAALAEDMGARVGSERATILVADPDGGGPVGWASSEVAPYGVATLSMGLAVAARGRGLGGELLAGIAEWAGGAGAHKLWLEVWPHNTAAIALYERAGFGEEGRKLRHYRRRSGELWDSVMMGRQL